jgi:hypothetical protein
MDIQENPKWKIFKMIENKDYIDGLEKMEDLTRDINSEPFSEEDEFTRAFLLKAMEIDYVFRRYIIGCFILYMKNLSTVIEEEE